MITPFAKSFLRTLYFIPALLLVFCVSCNSIKDSDNSNKTTVDLLEHFADSDLKVNSVAILRHDVVKAEEGLAIQLGEKQVGVYKYDIHNKKQLKKLNRIVESGILYIIGKKYPALSNGSFIMIDYDTHPDKEKIIEAFEDF